jgi:hypothetical protein
METRILIVEDAGPDRRRFRTLLNKCKESLPSDSLSYDFAWSAKDKAVKWELPLDAHRVRDEINRYDYVFLDLAWTKNEEDVMNKARRQSEEWLNDNLYEWNALPEETIELQNIEPEGLVNNISGFAFLDAISQDGRLLKPVAVTTGFYSLAVAKLCREKWGTPAFHKWEDENKIEAFLISALGEKINGM